MPLDDANYLDEPSRTLLMAAERVRKGWCQGTPVDAAGNVCALGALNDIAWNSRATYYEARKRIADYLDLEAREPWELHEVAYWNDESGRTAEEVASTMERVALAHVTATVD